MALTRTQISLSEPQRRFLQRRARQQGKSMAEVLRSLIDREMETPPSLEDDPFFGIIGMVRGNGTVTSENLDEHIYKKDW